MSEKEKVSFLRGEGFSFAHIAGALGKPKTTIYRMYNKADLRPKPGHPPLLTEAQEQEVRKFVTERALAHKPVSYDQLRSKVSILGGCLVFLS